MNNRKTIKINRSHFFTFLHLTLGAITLLGLYRAVIKVVFSHMYTLPEYLLYTPHEIKQMNWASYAFLMGGFALGLSAAGLLIRMLLYHRVWAIQRKDIVVTLPMLVLSWYISSFAILHTANTAFPYLLGTTPYCYSDPYFLLYKPLSDIAFHFQWVGKGNRYARKWIGVEP